MNNTISVIIPTYNRPQALQRSIESTLKQTVTPFEILVCEDGSSTEIKQIINNFNCPNIHWVPGTHAGRPAIPRNQGILAAKGDWLAFLDDDDLWLPEKLERQLKCAHESGCLAVCTNAWKLQNDKNAGLYFDYPLPNIFNFKQLLKSNMVICSSVLIHHSLFEKVIGFPESEKLRAIEDYALWLRVSTLTNFAYLEEPLLEYSDDPSQSIRKQGLSAHKQKHLIIQDFTIWAREIRLISDFIWQIHHFTFFQSIHCFWKTGLNLIYRVIRLFQ